MRHSRSIAAAFAALAASFAPLGAAHAQPVSELGPSVEPPPKPSASGVGTSGAIDDTLVDIGMRRSWNEGPVRRFAATTLDVGWVYVRPRLSLGYGRPFASWVGIDMNPIIGGQGLGAYGGLRLALPRIDVRFGPRYFYSFNREYLAPQGSYNARDLDSTAGDPARTLTLEAEIEASLPLGPGDVIALGSGSYVMSVPKNELVFEETLRVIVNPPLVWRARGGYVVRFGSSRQHSIGLVAEVLDVPNRDDSRTIRAGPIVRIVLSRRVEVRGSFVPTIVSPDHIGLVGGDFTELGFRYRWATE